MARCVARFVGISVLVVLGACARKDEPPPAYNEVLAHGADPLAPVPLVRPDVDGLPPVPSARYMKRISGASGAAAETEKPAETETAAPVALNDADPQELMQQFVELTRAGNLDAVAGMFVPDQQPIMKRIATAGKSIEAAVAKLRTALEGSNPELAQQFQPNEAGDIVLKGPDGAELPPITVRPVMELGAVETQGDDRATATVKEGAKEKKFELQKVEDSWRIRDPEVQSEDAVKFMLATVGNFARAMTEIADRVEKGELQAGDAMKELPAAIRRAAQTPPAEPKEGEAAPPAENPAGTAEPSA